MEQLGIHFPPPTTPSDIEALVACLSGKGWMTAIQIGVALGWSDRKVRAVASEADEVISYPGSPGYRLEIESTEEEYTHYRNARRAQARGMMVKVFRTDRRRRLRGQRLLPV